MEIDPIYFVSPLSVIAFSSGLVIYWHLKRKLTVWTFLYSLMAYAGAIALKYAVQIPTIEAFESATVSNPFALGFYYGSQTAFFEVGGAFLLASIAVSRGKFTADDAEGYGFGLAFWENAILFAIPLLITYIAYYALLLTPNSPESQTLYSTLTQDSPSLFYHPAEALPLIGYAILERVSSLLAHLSWGFLSVFAAITRRRGYLAVAFLLGFTIDFLVPFSPYVSLGVFELAIFVISLAGLAGALTITRGARERTQERGQAQVSHV